MLNVTIALIAGLGVGFLIRRRDFLLKYIDVVSIIFMFILLSVLGLSLGTNKEVIKNFKSVGMYAVAISITSIIGSSFAGFVVYRLFFKKSDRGKN